MAQAVLDTTVLFAASYRRDGAHDQALPILKGVDDGSLPDAIVPDYVLAETLNGLCTHAGHDAGVDLLDRIEENANFHVESLGGNLATAKGLFRHHQRLSFVDAAIVAYMQSEGIEYCYTFDDDFEGLDGVARLDTATNPYVPD